MASEEGLTPATVMILVVIDPMAGGTTTHRRSTIAEVTADYIQRTEAREIEAAILWVI